MRFRNPGRTLFFLGPKRGHVTLIYYFCIIIFLEYYCLLLYFERFPSHYVEVIWTESCRLTDMARAGYRVRYFLGTDRIASIPGVSKNVLSFSTKFRYRGAPQIDQCLTSARAIQKRTEQSALSISHGFVHRLKCARGDFSVCRLTK